METIKGGINASKGFRAAVAAAGLKYEDRDDMVLITSVVPCRAAGVFTRNVVQAAPVVRDRALLAEGLNVRAVLVNSGIAAENYDAARSEILRQLEDCAAGRCEAGPCTGSR